MIINANVITLFAEGIRQEVTGQHTLVGIFDDIVEFSNFPAILPQVTLFTTISTLVNNPFAPDSFKVLLASGETLVAHNLPSELKTQQTDAIQARTDDDHSPWINLRLVINITNIQVTENAKIFVEFEDSNGKRATSNRLTFKSKHQPDVVAPSRGK